ncbi:glycoside hydrolase family 16 protein [Tellurirhabdus bombi]|uniref:glycoside hydrolase family 16 protein n=1 Tax=Tellurirhabdus bombi TaxID=2907205 RepID=UPI001F445495|nr:glycoside hydrolase family 16 protein [Tellurirhabdus bombi]
MFRTLFCGLALSVFCACRMATPENDPPAKRKLVWADEFDQAGLPDPKKWKYDLGGNGFGNNELQYYLGPRTENARIEKGILIIEAHREKHENREYTSAKLITKGIAEWKYGRIEVRAKIPAGRGTWPAIWMLGSNLGKTPWPRCGEIDIMEHVGYNEGVVHGSLHTEAYNHVKGTQKTGTLPVPKATADFNTYAVEWSTDQLDFFINDQKYYSVTKKELGSEEAQWPLDQPYYLILNLAVGGNWGGQKGVDETIWPRRMEVDYVRVYQ